MCIRDRISIFNRKDEFYNQALINCKNINENTQSKAKVFDWADHEALRKEMNESYLFVNATGVGMKLI